MKADPPEPTKLAGELKKLQQRLANAQAESGRVSANRVASEKKLADLGRQLAGLKRDIAEVVNQNTRRK